MGTVTEQSGVDFLAAGLPKNLPSPSFAKIQATTPDELTAQVSYLGAEMTVLQNRFQTVLNFLNGLSFSSDFSGSLSQGGGQIALSEQPSVSGIEASGTEDLYKIIVLREEKKNPDGTWTLVQAGSEMGGYDSSSPTRRLRPYWDYLRVRRVISS